MPIKHAFTSLKDDSADTTLVRPSNWNADHLITDFGACIIVAASDASAAAKAAALASGGAVCDGTADQVEIQAALDALPATGGEVRLSEGSFSVTAGITHKANCIIEGAGSSATKVVVPLGTGSIQVFNGSDVNNWVVRGLTLVGDGDVGTGIYASHNISNVLIEDIIAYDFQVGININSASHVRIRRCHCYSNALEGIYVHQETLYNRSSDVLIEDCEVNNNGRNGMSTENSDYWTIDHCYAHNNTAYGYHYESSPPGEFGMVINSRSKGDVYGIAIGANIEQVIVADNLIEDSTSYGITTDGTRGIITGNTMRNCGDWGINRGQIISDNIIEGDGNATSRGIFTENNNADVHDNQIIGTLGTGAIWFGTSDGQRWHNNLLKDNLWTGYSEANLACTNLQFYENTIINSTYENFTRVNYDWIYETVCRSWNNWINGKPTDNSGTAIVLNATTSIKVAHGLADIPTRVQITATLWSNATKAWVSSKDSDADGLKFTITVDQDPGAGTAVFDWDAQIGEG